MHATLLGTYVFSIEAKKIARILCLLLNWVAFFFPLFLDQASLMKKSKDLTCWPPALPLFKHFKPQITIFVKV